MNFTSTTEIKNISYCKFQQPFKRDFKTANTFFMSRDGFYLKLILRNGEIRYGEAAPLFGFSSESVEEVAANLKTASHKKILAQYEQEALPASLQMAFDAALLDIIGKKTEPLELNAVFDLGASLASIKNKVDAGFRSLKFKISPAVAEPMALLLYEITAILGEKIKIRLGANSSFSFSEAQKFLQQLKNIPIEFIEDLLLPSDTSFCFALQKETNIPHFTDQNLQNSFEEKINSPAFQGFVIKPSCFGGLKKTERAIKSIESQGKKVVLSSALETELGILSLLNFSLLLEGKSSAFGFDTLHLFEEPHLNIEADLLDFLPVPWALKQKMNALSWTEL